MLDPLASRIVRAAGMRTDWGPGEPSRDDGRGRWSWFLRWQLLMLALWVAAWMLYEGWFVPHGWLLGTWRSTSWWTIAKLAIWIAPPLWILRRAGEKLGEATGLATLRGVRRGLGLAAAWLAFQLIVSLLRDHWPGPFRWSSGAWNAFLVAPLFEEIVFRGFALRRLRRQGIRFWPAAAATSVAFGLMHVPGWLFTKGATPAILGSFANVMFVGMLLAAIAWRTPSLWACVAFHFVNNAWSEGLVLALFR